MEVTTLAVVVVLTFVANVQGQADKAKAVEISPNIGSLNGETRITIYGENFSKNQFNFGAGNDHLGNKVLLTSDTHEYECKIHKDGCTERQITCYTPPMLEGNYFIKLSIDGEDVPLPNHCGHREGRAYNCMFRAAEWRTPYIDYLEENEGAPGLELKMRVRMFSNRFGTNNATSSNGREEKITRVYGPGGLLCDLIKPGTDQAFKLDLDNEGKSDWGYMNCQAQGTFIGHSNVSFIVDGQFGRSQAKPLSKNIFRKGKVASVQTFAEITSLSSQQTGGKGGELLTVNGKYFDDSDIPAEVLVGGSPCKVESLTPDQIVCRVPQKPASASLRGNRGWTRETWMETKDTPINEISDLIDPQLTNWTANGKFFLLSQNDDGDRYSTRHRGFFVPWDTNDYRFFVQGDDSVEVYFSTTSDPADKVKIASSPSATDKFDQLPEQKSEKFSLEADKEYYIEVVHKELYGHSGFRLAAQMYRTKFTGKQTGQAKNDKQTIVVNSTKVDEVQTISFDKWATGSPVFEKQVFEVSAASANDRLDDATFRIGLYGVFTKPLSGVATASQVQAALMDLPVISPETVRVEVVSTSGAAGQTIASTYTITINSQRGDFPDFEGIKDSKSQININFKVTEETKGKPSGQLVALQFGDVPSTTLFPFSQISASRIQSSVERMFSVRCPKTLTIPYIGTKFMQTFETASAVLGIEDGKRSNEVEAFCGEYSLKNPTNIFRREKEELSPQVDLSKAGKVCFAHFGKILPQLVAYYDYMLSTESDPKTGSGTFEFEFNQQADGWSWNCVDLFSAVYARHGGGVDMTDVFVDRIAISKEFSNEDVYIDHVIITKTPRVTDYEGAAKYRRLRPINAKLDSVEVKDTTSGDVKSYEVTLKQRDCPPPLSVLAISNAKVVSSTADSATYEVASGSSATVTRVQAASGPLTGTFDLTYKGKKLRNLPANIEPHILQGKLQPFFDEGDIYVSRVGECDAYNWTIEWTSNGGDKDNLAVDASKIQGNGAAGQIHNEQDGGIFFDPIPGDMIYSYNGKPQVTVYINDIPVKCSGDCSFNWDDAIVPTVTGVGPSSGSKDAGTQVDITGSGFSSNAAENIVEIGGAACTVTSASGSLLVCSVGEGPAGPQDIVVVVKGKGEASQVGGPFQFSYDFSATAINPSSGSLGGGSLLTITGTGFGASLTATVGGESCTVVESDYDQLVCQLPAAASAGSVDVVLRQGATTKTVPSQFTYDAGLTPTVTSFSTNNAAVAGGTILDIAGSGFGASASSNDAIQVCGTPAKVVSYSDTQVQVELPACAPGSYKLDFDVAGKGLADVRSAGNIVYRLKVTNVSPRAGSTEGRNKITITGQGFSEDLTTNNIMFGNTPCEVESATTSQVVCTMGPGGNVIEITNQGEDAVYGKGFSWEPSSVQVKVGDIIHWKWWSDASVDNLKYKIEQTADSVQNKSKSNGFNSGGEGSSNGQFRYEVTSTGTFYYWSTFVTGWKSMRGMIVASPQESSVKELTFTIGEFEAEYDTSASASPSNCASVAAGCTGPSGNDASRFYYSFLTCATPQVAAVSLPNGDSASDLVITGSGFGNQACTSVSLGDLVCNIKSQTSSRIACTLDTSSGNIPVGKPLSVNVADGLGSAMVMPHANEQREVEILPHITSISPAGGSIKGGTFVTISGTGLCDSCGISKRSTDLSNKVVVAFGATPCEVTSASFDEVVCKTSMPPGASTLQVSVTVNSAGTGIPATCSGACPSFSFSNNQTPQVSSISPSTISQSNSILTIDGDLFGSVVADVSVKIGEVACTVVSVSNTQITCNVGEPVTGRQPLVVAIAGSGVAQSSVPTVTVSADISSMSPSSGSTEGGLQLVIAGVGFAVDTTVSVDGVDADIVSVSGSQVIAVTPAHAAGSVQVEVISNRVKYTKQDFTYDAAATPAVTSVSPTSGVAGDSITISGSGFGNAANAVSVSINGTVCSVTSASDSSVSCTLGNHAAGSFPIALSVASKGFASGNVAFEYALGIDSLSSSEGSLAGGQLLTLTGRGFDADTVITICDNVCKTQGTPTPTSLTCKTPGNSAGGDLNCYVKASNGNLVKTAASQYRYRGSLTPEVTSVSPARGGTAGGTRITISGSGFGASQNAVSVSIGGSQCIIASFSSSRIECVTESRKPSIKTQVEVEIGGNGIAKQTSADYEYVDRWSSKFSWGGADPPAEGDMVVIPKDMTIVLDQDTPIIKLLLIQGGKLIFDDKDVELNAENILITDGGLLQVGTEDKPFENKGIITLHGHTMAKELPIYGTKMIAIREGTLDLHGKPVGLTWTLLGQTANAGSNTLVLSQPVSWSAGDEIAIATTGTRHTQNENEKAKIAAISADGLTLTLEAPLAYKHLGETVTVDAGVTLEARAEVGLLTHNVVVRGSDNKQWHDKIEKCEAGFDTGEFATQTCFQGRFGEEIGSDEFGGQIIFHAPRMDENLVVGRIENVELTYTGQAFRLGRYSIHFHLNGDMQGSYVRGCGIHNTFNRVVNIHGTHNVMVERNVAYNIKGGAFFLEDGIETGNTFQYNCAILVKASSSLQNDDITPAAYWLTNPNNTVRHNHAAGGTHFGVWYRMHKHPDAASFDPNICPQRVPLGEFFNNTVHSQGWFGVWIFMQWHPMVGGGCDATVPQAADLKRLIAWNCEKGYESVTTGAIHLSDSLLVHNEVAGAEVKMIGIVDPYIEDKTALVKDTVIAASAGILDTKPTKKGVVSPLGRGWIVKNVKFVNFNLAQGKDQACFWCAKIDGTSDLYNGGFRYDVSGLQFVNSPNKVLFQWDNEADYYDLDGSMCGSAGCRVVPKSGTRPPSCTQQSVFSANADVPGVACPSSVEFFRFSWNEYAPKTLEGQNATFENQYGTTIARYSGKRMTHKSGWMVLLHKNDMYKMEFVHGYQITNISYAGRFYDFENDDYVIIQHNFTQQVDNFKVTEDAKNESDSMVSFGNNEFGDWFFNDDEKMFSYLVSGKDPNPEMKLNYGPSDRDIDLDVYRCFFEGCLTPVDPDTLPPADKRPADAVFWSQKESWKDAPEGYGGNLGNGAYDLPVAGDNVKIIRDKWLVLDVEDLPELGIVEVEGTLEFEYKPKSGSGNNAVYYNLNLIADHVIINGGRLIVGWEDDPFLGSAQITLKGDHFSPDFPVFGGPNIGGKAIGVFGGLDMHGKPREVSWTQVTASVAKGDSTVAVKDAVDWVAGDVIVVATTSFNATENERKTIQSVSADQKTITVDTPFSFGHLYAKETVNGKEIVLAAEVGLVSRNVKIVGQAYAKQETELFGARLIVGKMADGENEQIGYARLSNIEFYHCGQDGWGDPYDPRFSLSFLDTGEVSDVKPSYVKKCAFNENYSPALGVYGAKGIVLEDNVVYRTVGAGVKIEGEATEVRRNLVMGTFSFGSFGERNIMQLQWEGAFELQNGADHIFENNHVAGTERAAFRMDGQACGTVDNLFSGNVGHSGQIGVQLVPMPGEEYDGTSPCTLITGFTIWKEYDFGIYTQTQYPTEIDNCAVLDSGLGLFPMVFSPASSKHLYANQYVKVTNTIFVGASGASSCDDVLDPKDDNMVNSDMGRGPRTPSDGKIGTITPIFASGTNGLPKHPYAGSMSYQTINGLMTMEGCTFAKFGSECGKENVAISGSPLVDDAQFPLKMKSTVVENVDNPVYFPVPRVAVINPADCVDMDCDAMKKLLVEDLDGSFMGSSGAYIAWSEYEWDGEDKRRGYGDFRIPKSMLTDVNGDRIPVDQIATGRGIIRDNSCTFHAEYRAWKCHNLDYEMLQVESMDHDTETRRLSPIAIVGDKYIDLINGPQDHGWCMGYTCQKRLSLFPIVVATGKRYEMHYTGTSPQDSRFHLLNTDNSQAIILAIHYQASWRLDVSVDGKYIMPKNGEMNDAGQLVLKDESTPGSGEYMPNLASDPSGTSWWDGQTKMLNLLLKGSTPVNIVTNNAIFISFDLPMMTVDEFFGPQIVTNLAAFLNIPEDRIKVAHAVREDGNRRKRTSTVQVYVEIANPPRDYGVADASDLTDADMYAISQSIINAYQLGDMPGVLNITDILSMTIVEPPLATDSDTWKVFAEAKVSPEKSMLIPDLLSIDTAPAGVTEGKAFTTQPKIVARDANGDVIQQLGGQLEPWILTATLRRLSGSGSLSGTTSVPYTNGAFSFVDLTISGSGKYILDFTVTSPSAATYFKVSSMTIEVGDLNVGGTPVDEPKSVESGGSFDTKVGITDAETGKELGNDKGLDWKCFVSLYMPEMYKGKLANMPFSVVDSTTGQATFKDLSFTHPGRYFLQYQCVSYPEEYDYTFIGDAIDVFPVGYVTPVVEIEKKIKIRFNGNFADVAQGNETYFAAYLYNKFDIAVSNVTMSEEQISAGSIIAEFTLGGPEYLVNNMVDTIYAECQTPLTFTFRGHSVSATGEMWVNSVPYTGTAQAEPMDAMTLGLIIGCSLLGLLLLVAIIAGIVVYKVKSRTDVCPSTSSKHHMMMSSSSESSSLNSSPTQSTTDLLSDLPNKRPPSKMSYADSGRASRISNMSAATSAYGNTVPMSPTDIDLPSRLVTPVSSARHNGPMRTSGLRRESSAIPDVFKMPGAE